jgi:hypothetical protein
MQNEQHLERPRWNLFLGPAFLIFLLLAFFITPGTTLEKFYMVCFGI